MLRRRHTGVTGVVKLRQETGAESRNPEAGTGGRKRTLLPPVLWPQKLTRTPNCETRGPPTVDVTVPKSVLSKLFSGIPKLTVLKTLKTSNRSSARARPPRWTRLETLRSTRFWLGPRRKL